MKKIGLIVFAAIAISSCTKKEDLIIPTKYESASYDTNTANEKALRTQLSALTTEMKTAEKGTTLTLDKLNNLFTSGSPSLKSITGTYYVNKIEGALFKELVESSGKVYDATKPNTTGGVYGGRLLNAGGLETLQEIEKGLFGAAFFNYAVGLMKGAITEKTIDQLVSIYGASQNFPNTNTAANTPTPDAFGALYAARRDKNNGTGFYTNIKNAFLTAQAAVKAGEDYNSERDAALKTVKSEWEKALLATVIHYNFAALTKFSTTNPPATTLSGGLHDLGEGIGFLHGMKAVPSSDRKITDAQIDEVIALISNANNGKAEMYKYTTEPSSLAKIQSASTKIQAIYGFTAAEMEDFKKNWISEQGR